MKINLIFPEVAFITEFPGSNFLQPTFLTGGKWDVQLENLLLATVNFEPCRNTSDSCLMRFYLFLCNKNLRSF